MHGNLEKIALGLEAAGVPVLYLGDLFERPEVSDNATFDLYRPVPERPEHETMRYAVIAARLGRTDDMKQYLLDHLKNHPWPTLLPNGLSTLEGGGSMQYLGTCSDALQQALLQCLAPKPGGDPVLRVFPAWPTEWDAAFQLLAKGGFLVTSSMRRGQIEFVEIRSQLGGECRIRNPWVSDGATLYRNGRQIEDLAGSLLKLPTHEDEILILVKSGSAPEQFKRSVPEDRV